jgi:hypothetical protein
VSPKVSVLHLLYIKSVVFVRKGWGGVYSEVFWELILPNKEVDGLIVLMLCIHNSEVDRYCARHYLGYTPGFVSHMTSAWRTGGS